MSYLVVLLLVFFALLALICVFCIQQFDIRWRTIFVCCALILALFGAATVSYHAFGTVNLFSGVASFWQLQHNLNDAEEDDTPRYTAVDGTKWPHAYFLAAQDVSGVEVKEMFIDLFGTEGKWKISDVKDGDTWGTLYQGALTAGNVQLTRRDGYTLVAFVSYNYST